MDFNEWLKKSKENDNIIEKYNKGIIDHEIEKAIKISLGYDDNTSNLKKHYDICEFSRVNTLDTNNSQHEFMLNLVQLVVKMDKKIENLEKLYKKIE